MSAVLHDRNKFATLINACNQWGVDRGLTLDNGAKLQAQVFKLKEELDELILAYEENDDAGIVDGLGDALVVIIQLSRLTNVPLDVALDAAYEEIKDRKGTMKFGIFVKGTTLAELESEGTPLSSIMCLADLEKSLGKLSAKKAEKQTGEYGENS